MTWTDDPTRDAERYYTRITAAQEQWEKENYVGRCPLCGKPMFTGAYDSHENAVEDETGEFEYVHEFCQMLRDAEEEYEEAFDDQMGNPMDELDNILKVTA